MKAKKYLIIIWIVLTSNNIFSQTKINYKQLFADTISEAKTEKEYFIKAKECFSEIDNKELPIALAEISKGMSKNAIAYNIFALIKDKLNDKDVQKEMIIQLSIDNNLHEFKFVLIDFISANIKDSEEFNTELFKLAKNITQPDWLRKYAASHIKKAGSYEVLKVRLSELLESKNKAVMNGTSKAIESIIKSGLSKSEKNYWVDNLIVKLNENQDSILELKGVVSGLGNIKSVKSKNILLEYFNKNSSSNKAFSEVFAYALINNADKKEINAVFSAYHKNKHFSGFGSELLLKRMANNNTDILDDLILSKDIESKLNYLRAVKHLKPTEREKHLSNAINSLKSENAQIRLEAVKTLHFILPYEEEIEIFREHVIAEESKEVKNEIYSYVGF